MKVSRYEILSGTATLIVSSKRNGWAFVRPMRRMQMRPSLCSSRRTFAYSMKTVILKSIPICALSHQD